jgi:hypothetical protein
VNGPGHFQALTPVGHFRLEKEKNELENKIETLKKDRMMAVKLESESEKKLESIGLLKIVIDSFNIKTEYGIAGTEG